jgi:UDP-N-acetylmuramoyl-L-alanyl-D-glutamate--2,6-diaminopimelate ligase
LRLNELLNGEATALVGVKKSAEIDIAGLTADSRQVRDGYLFAALPGARADGRRYIDEALASGAAAILAPTGTALADITVGHAERPLALTTADNPRQRLAQIAARFYGPQPATIAAVTGTNGKTSVANFARQIWSRMGRNAASLGTLGLQTPSKFVPGALTTPDAVTLHRVLAELKAEGVEHVAMEASSHGLAQYRLDGVRLTAAAFTNLTRDHLDYHQTIEAYFAAKTRLFTELLPQDSMAVLNADVPEYETLRALCAARGQRIIAYGEAGPDIRVAVRNALPHGQRVRFEIAGDGMDIDLPLVGHFQAMNVACALSLVIATGGAARVALETLEQLEGIPGRMQLAAEHPTGAAVYVDYAHTPDALANVLQALRPHARGRLMVVFGCGGDRDAGKRPQMGRIASALADRVIITDDNPRGENPAAIRRAVMAGADGAIEIGDRAAAIDAAVAELRAGDVLVLAGKGHEQGQIIGDSVIPFDDANEARQAVARHGARTGGRT